jgi:hypothetical protein
LKVRHRRPLLAGSVGGERLLTHMKLSMRQTTLGVGKASIPVTEVRRLTSNGHQTAMVALLRRHLKNEAEARALIRDLLVASADIDPNDVAKTLTIRIHHIANRTQDTAVAALLDDLTRQAFCHPETGAKMIYTLA